MGMQLSRELEPRSQMRSIGMGTPARTRIGTITAPAWAHPTPPAALYSHMLSTAFPSTGHCPTVKLAAWTAATGGRIHPLETTSTMHAQSDRWMRPQITVTGGLQLLRGSMWLAVTGEQSRRMRSAPAQTELYRPTAYL